VKRSFRYCVAAGTAVLLMLGGAPAHAETRRVKDSYNKSAPALNVKHGRFSYEEDLASFRVKFESLNRKRTSLVVRYYAPKYTIQVQTKYVKGSKRTITHKITDTDYERISNKHVRAAWNFRADVIRVVIREPHLQGRRAGFHAWSQHKHALHGNYEGDELMVPRLRRG
jgi:hypothetical protein